MVQFELSLNGFRVSCPLIGATYSDALMLLQPMSELEAFEQGVSKTHGYIVGIWCRDRRVNQGYVMTYEH